MYYQIVYVFGVGVYCVFIVLFLLVVCILCMLFGVNWFVVVISCVLLGWLVVLYFMLLGELVLVNLVYGSFLILEKVLLVMGFVCFFDLQQRMLLVCVVGVVVVVVGLWMLWFDNQLVLLFIKSISYVIFNVFVLGSLLWMILYDKFDCLLLICCCMVMVCIVLMLYWVSGGLIGYFYLFWLCYGFLLGMVLVVLQYMSLFMVILVLFYCCLIQVEVKVFKMVFKDLFIGFYNKYFMNNLFDQVLLLVICLYYLVVVYYIDLDNFKFVNDQVGYVVGDKVFMCVVQWFMEVVCSIDICVCLGGDEFIVIVIQLECQEQVLEIVKKLLVKLVVFIEVGYQ